jgi:hypothetical protein
MFTLISSITVSDVDMFVAGAKSQPQEHFDQWGVVENNIYRSVDQNVAIIINTYNTLEEAQKHKSDLESPEMKAGLEQMGVSSFDLWLVEKSE